MDDIYTFEDINFQDSLIEDYKIFSSYNLISFSNILQQTGSVITGGIVLDSLSEFKNNKPESLYIYSTFTGARLIGEFLKDYKIVTKEDQNVTVVTPDLSPDKESSFFLKTGVRVILEYSIDPIKTSSIKKVKIMVVDKDEDVIGAITNFDLSFTRVWFDGKHIKTITPVDDIKNKIGYLDEEYIELLINFNPKIIKRMMKYRERGFAITYNTPTTNISVTIKKTNVMKVVCTNEERLVKSLYTSLLNSLITDFLINNGGIYTDGTYDNDYIPILGNADIYLKYFELENFSLNSFVELLKKLSDNICVLPFWIRSEYGKAQTEVFNALLLEECGFLKLCINEPEGVYRNFIHSILKKLGFKIDSLEEILKQYKKIIYEFSNNFGHEMIYTKKIYAKQKNLCMLNDEEDRMISSTSNVRKNTGTRNIPWLDLVKPTKTENVRFREAAKIEEFKGCYDIEHISIYDINSYLSGEEIEGYNDKGEKDMDYNIPAVSPEVARERLVFFVAKSWDDLNDLSPYCYDLKYLEKDISKQIFYECDGGDIPSSSKDKPIIQLNVGGRVYVPLGEFLHALYKTRKQTFILIPTEKEIARTGSLASTYGNSNVSTTHCGEGTNIKLHTIRSCTGQRKRTRGGRQGSLRGQQDMCWPVTEGLQIAEIGDRRFLLSNIYYANEELINKLESEKDNLELSLSKIKLSLVFLGEIGYLEKFNKIQEYGVRILFLIEISTKLDELTEMNERELNDSLRDIEDEIRQILTRGTRIEDSVI